MNKSALGWTKIIGSGAAGAAAPIAAVLAAGGPITWVIGVIAGLAFLAGAGTTASALYQEAPAKADAPKP